MFQSPKLDVLRIGEHILDQLVQRRPASPRRLDAPIGGVEQHADLPHQVDIHVQIARKRLPLVEAQRPRLGPLRRRGCAGGVGIAQGCSSRWTLAVEWPARGEFPELFDRGLKSERERGRG